MSPSIPFSLSAGSIFFQDKAKESITGSVRTSVSLVTISSVMDSIGFGAGVSVGSTVGSTIGDGGAVSISVSGVRIGLIFVVPVKVSTTNAPIISTTAPKIAIPRWVLFCLDKNHHSFIVYFWCVSLLFCPSFDGQFLEVFKRGSTLLGCSFTSCYL